MIDTAASRPSRGRYARPGWTLSVLAQSESIFALSNGHIGLRANLEEGEPHACRAHIPTAYEEHPLPYAEPGYGYPEVGQTLVNVTNGKVIRLLVDDESFDVRYGRLRATSASSTCVPGCCGARPSGSPRQGRRYDCPRCASSRLPSARSQPSCTKSSRSTLRRGWWCSPSLWQTSRCQPPSRTIPAPALGWALHCVPSSSPTTTPE